MGVWGSWGLRFLAVGLSGLGLVGLIHGRLIEGLQPAEVASLLARINAAAFLVVGLALLSPTRRNLGGWGLLALMVLSLAIQAGGLIASPQTLPLWVPATQALALAGAGWTLTGSDPVRARLFGRVAAGLMVLLFGVVHLIYREAIAGLIPAGLPLRELWPWLTGAAQVAAGGLIVLGRWARPAALLIGAMFLAWLPAVHLSRLAAAPFDPVEQTFALTALALAGVLWLTTSGKAPGQE